MMKRRFLSVALTIGIAASAFLFGGCETMQSRISAHPEIYQSLSPQDQQLVAAGQIRSGMAENAVWLSWGAPEQRMRGEIHGRPSETWVYTTYSDIAPYGPYRGGYGYPYGGSGFGYGGGYVLRNRHGRSFFVYGDPFYDPWYSAIPPRVEVPYKTVTFVNGRVVSWQHVAPTGMRY